MTRRALSLLTMALAATALLLLASCEEPVDGVADETPTAAATPEAPASTTAQPTATQEPTATATTQPTATPEPSVTATPSPAPTRFVPGTRGVTSLNTAVKDRDDCADDAATGDPSWPAGTEVRLMARGAGECDGWYNVQLADDPSLTVTGVRNEYLVSVSATPTPTPVPLSEPDPVTACRSAESLIQKNLRAPSTADWTGNCWLADGRGGSGYGVTHDRDAGTSLWLIGVDSQNAFGAMIRTHCFVEADWRADTVELLACE